MTEFTNTIPLLLGGAWATGFRMYLTISCLGIAHRMHWVNLPGTLDIFANPLVIGVAGLLAVVEFCADKIPAVDNAWDAIHTFIRPVGGIALGYLATSGMNPGIQYSAALFTGAIAFNAHVTKATTRAAVNTTTVPFTNSAVSLTEDAGTVGIMYLVVKHPVIASIIVIGLIALSIWFLKVMFRLVKRLFTGQNSVAAMKPTPPQPAPTTPQPDQPATE